MLKHVQHSGVNRNRSNVLFRLLNRFLGLFSNPVADDFSLYAEEETFEKQIEEELFSFIWETVSDLPETAAFSSAISHNPFSLQVLLSNIEALYAPLAAEKGVEFSMNAGNQVDGWFIGDQAKIAGILRSVINHAIHSTEHGEIAVTSLFRNDCLRFSVSHTGDSLSQDGLNILFREDDRENPDGSGKTNPNEPAGLSLARSLCEIIGGRITIKGELAVGTILTVSLPLEKADPESVGSASGEEMILQWREKYRNVPDMAVVLNRGLDCLKDEIRQLSVLAGDGRWSDVSEKLHSMKGFPGGFGLSEIYRRIKAMEETIGQDNTDRSVFFQQLSDLQQFSNTIPPLEESGKGAPPFDGERKPRDCTGESANQLNRVLVADDDQMNCEMIEYLLRKIDVCYDIVHNGEEVLDALMARQYDLLLLDIRMPVLGGVATLKRIRRQPALRQLYIIAMTANDNSGDEDRFKTLGCNAFVAKPIDLEELTGKIRKAIVPRGDGN